MPVSKKKYSYYNRKKYWRRLRRKKFYKIANNYGMCTATYNFEVKPLRTVVDTSYVMTDYRLCKYYSDAAGATEWSLVNLLLDNQFEENEFLKYKSLFSLFKIKSADVKVNLKYDPSINRIVFNNESYIAFCLNLTEPTSLKTFKAGDKSNGLLKIYPADKENNNFRHMKLYNRVNQWFATDMTSGTNSTWGQQNKGSFSISGPDPTGKDYALFDRYQQYYVQLSLVIIFKNKII